MDDYVLARNPVLSACQLVGTSIRLPLDENQTIEYEMPLIFVFLILIGAVIADNWLGVFLIISRSMHVGCEEADTGELICPGSLRTLAIIRK